MHPLFQSKPRLAVLLSMVFLLQCCCCILPIRWNVTQRPVESPYIVELPQDSVECADRGESRFARSSAGEVFVSLDQGRQWSPVAPQSGQIPDTCSLGWWED